MSNTTKKPLTAGMMAVYDFIDQVDDKPITTGQIIVLPPYGEVKIVHDDPTH